MDSGKRTRLIPQCRFIGLVLHHLIKSLKCRFLLVCKYGWRPVGILAHEFNECLANYMKSKKPTRSVLNRRQLTASVIDYTLFLPLT